MRVFVTGGSGWVGRHVVAELLSCGHSVLGLARSAGAAEVLTSLGAEVLVGDLTDVGALRSGSASCDGVIHCAFVHDFTRFQQSCATDRLAIDTIGAVLAGTSKPFVSTFGSLGVDAPAGRTATEEDPAHTTGMAGARAATENTVLALAAQGVRATLIRLPPSVHGTGDGGFVPTLIALARKNTMSVYVGEGTSRWPSVHVLDAARLYRLALEKGQAGSRYHAVADEGVPSKAIAEAIGRALAVPTVSKTAEEAPAALSFLAHFFAADNPTSSNSTQHSLGWKPQECTLLQDLAQPHYFDQSISKSKYVQ